MQIREIMKITKIASGKQIIKISKKEWINIGKKAGWIKTSQVDPNSQGENKIYEYLISVFLGEKIPFDISDLEGNVIIPAKKTINKTMLYQLYEKYPNVNIPESPIKNMINKKFNQNK
jgi:hypothetical protein